MQLLESQDPALVDQIRASQELLKLVREIAARPTPEADQAEAEEASLDGEREIVELAKTALELLEDA